MDGYFSYLAADKATLRHYELDGWPTEQQLATIVFDLDAKYTALFRALGYYAEKDVRGRWHVYRTEKVQ